MNEKGKEKIREKSTSLGHWWFEIGKWQVLMTVITLAVFFVTLHSENMDAISAMFATFIFVLLGGVAIAAASVSLATFDTGAAFVTAIALAAAAPAAAFVVLAISLAIFATPATVDTSTAVDTPGASLTAVALIFVSVFVVILAIAAIVAVARKNSDISKKIIWFSYAMEFVVILLPMLGRSLNWW